MVSRFGLKVGPMTSPTSLLHELGPGVQHDPLPTLAGVSVKALLSELMPEGVARHAVACLFTDGCIASSICP